MIGYIIFAFAVGFLFCLPVVIWSLMNLEVKLSNRTIELQTEIENLKIERYDRADKHEETREELAKVTIERDRLALQYKILLEEKTK